ncbi:large ribosomal subunit protein mL38-like isoform X2 [Apostichopus japonicus]
MQGQQTKERREHLQNQKSKLQLEKSARLRQLEIPLDEVRRKWETTSAPYHIRATGHHYNIFTDLFDGADFLSHVVMKIFFECPDEGFMPVYYGNVITPTEALKPPTVHYDCDAGNLWTLLMVNPDGHLIYNDAEYVHWMIGNIPDEKLSEGDTIFDYLPVFPAKGTGYQRIVFLLFKQDGKVNYSDEIVPLPCRSLPNRTFSTHEFYAKYQDVLTPVGLSFSQCRWDQSVTAIFHDTLDMREPIFEYDVPKLPVLPQMKWPHRKTLNYLKQYLPDD